MFKGSITALVTPMRDGRVDEEGFRAFEFRLFPVAAIGKGAGHVGHGAERRPCLPFHRLPPVVELPRRPELVEHENGMATEGKLPGVKVTKSDAMHVVLHMDPA